MLLIMIHAGINQHQIKMLEKPVSHYFSFTSNFTGHFNLHDHISKSFSKTYRIYFIPFLAAHLSGPLGRTLSCEPLHWSYCAVPQSYVHLASPLYLAVPDHHRPTTACHLLKHMNLLLTMGISYCHACMLTLWILHPGVCSSSLVNYNYTR